MWGVFFHFEKASVMTDILWSFVDPCQLYYCFMRDRIAYNIDNYLIENCSILIYVTT